MKEKLIKLSKIEKALIVLARHIDRCPYNDYAVEKQVLEELGYEKKAKK
jgi:hypothetical protein